MQPGEAQILCVFVATLKYLDKPNLLNFRQNNEHIWGVVRDKKEYRGGAAKQLAAAQDKHTLGYECYGSLCMFVCVG